jgi:hypothetical protein
MRFLDMNTLEQIDYIKRLWATAMPPGIATPSDDTFATWVVTTDARELEPTILRVGRKMAKNMSQGIAVEPNAAAKYCSSVFKHYLRARRDVTC